MFVSIVMSNEKNRARFLAVAITARMAARFFLRAAASDDASPMGA
jgi:hypothetical protein